MKLRINNKLLPGSNSVYIDGTSNGILMLHSIGSTPLEFGFFLQRFEHRGYSLHAPLLKGHGTTAADLGKCTWRDWFNHAKTELFELRKKCKRITIIGQSLGATLALHLAAHYQVEALILMSPGLILKNNTFASKTKILPASKIRIPNIKDTTAGKTFIGYNYIPTKTLDQIQALFSHLKDDLADIHIPVLLFHGRNDAIFDYLGAQYIYGNISSKTKQFLALDNSYHLLSLDFEKEIILKETDRFIEKVFDESVNRQGA